MKPRKDRYRYFRVEARELLEGLASGVLELERGAADPAAVVSRLLRLAHTFKGSARVVQQPKMAEHAHAIEDLLSARRDDASRLDGEQAGALLHLVDEIRRLVDAIEPPPTEASVPEAPREAAASSGTTRAPTEAWAETVRVDIGEMDGLLRSVTHTAVVFGGVRQQLQELAARVRAGASLDELAPLLRSVEAGADRVEAGITDTHERAHAARLVPARTIFDGLERVARDAASALGRSVDFDARGGDVRLDAHVLGAVASALAHVVRNAVAHGVEPAPDRVAGGKPARGAVRVQVERRGARVLFACDDDGRGVDVESVRRRAIERGVVDAATARALDARAVHELLAAGGITTSDAVTEIAGRGIGLDVVRATAERLRGEIRVASEPGRGARFELEVPVSIASLDALVVEAGDVCATIPLDAVRRALRLSPEDVATVGGRESIAHEGKQIPFVHLGRALRVRDDGRPRAACSAIVVSSGGATAAVGVDRLLGTTSAVLQSLPAYVAADPIVAAAALDADGNPRLVLDARGLVDAASRARGASARPAPRPPPLPVLVVDDSLTTRMLEKSILESAGYAVHVATSAEEALAKASAQRYAFFVVDVEMPGMDGFGFVAATRADPALRDVPAALVTSRDAPEDRARGLAVGAVAYIVKAEFDQGVLLDTLKRWIR